MLGWTLFFGIGILFQIANLILRRFQVGRQIIRISGHLFWLFLVAVVADIIGTDALRTPIAGGRFVLSFHWFAMLIFLHSSIYTFFQFLYQIVGDWYVNAAHIGKMPTQESYTQKGEYILPFTGKWTVFNGGTDKNLQHGGSASQTMLMTSSSCMMRGNLLRESLRIYTATIATQKTSLPWRTVKLWQCARNQKTALLTESMYIVTA